MYINNTQCFEGISPESWAHRVGGYQVLEKWLKDRKGRELSFDDIMHYINICAALERTKAVMDSIDADILASGGFPLE